MSVILVCFLCLIVEAVFAIPLMLLFLNAILGNNMCGVVVLKRMLARKLLHGNPHLRSPVFA